VPLIEVQYLKDVPAHFNVPSLLVLYSNLNKAMLILLEGTQDHSIRKSYLIFQRSHSEEKLYVIS